MSRFTIGSGQRLEAADEMTLLAGIEAALDFCLASGNVFAIFDHQSDFCQIALDPEGNLHLETTFGEFASHAGFHEQAEEWPWHSGNFLPSFWHARAKMVASAMTRAFIDAGNMTFPAVVMVEILPTGNGNVAEVASVERPAPVERAKTIGFLFAADRPRGWFAEQIAPSLDLPPHTSIEKVKKRIHQLVEAEAGPLNRNEAAPASADYIVELCSAGNLWTCTTSDNTTLIAKG